MHRLDGWIVQSYERRWFFVEGLTRFDEMFFLNVCFDAIDFCFHSIEKFFNWMFSWRIFVWLIWLTNRFDTNEHLKSAGFFFNGRQRHRRPCSELHRQGSGTRPTRIERDRDAITYIRWKRLLFSLIFPLIYSLIPFNTKIVLFNVYFCSFQPMDVKWEKVLCAKNSRPILGSRSKRLSRRILFVVFLFTFISFFLC